jgi:hypothetical protein
MYGDDLVLSKPFFKNFCNFAGGNISANILVDSSNENRVSCSIKVCPFVVRLEFKISHLPAKSENKGVGK